MSHANTLAYSLFLTNTEDLHGLEKYIVKYKTFIFHLMSLQCFLIRQKGQFTQLMTFDQSYIRECQEYSKLSFYYKGGQLKNLKSQIYFDLFNTFLVTT